MDEATELMSSHKASGAGTSSTKWKLRGGRFQDNKRQQVRMQGGVKPNREKCHLHDLYTEKNDIINVMLTRTQFVSSSLQYR